MNVLSHQAAATDSVSLNDRLDGSLYKLDIRVSVTIVL
ncbi:hypothetical protein VCSRO104_0386 [Vibrio cholerae]|nr:hypothetical protein VAB027_2440 [Vibrio cholerae]GHW04803.1 hypothetical protein VCSRO54_0370 [Vibrio cholerae]GHW73895.1 hypothetical protein VCSRO198_3358 [Vibrio cholerae]GHW75153.1 hypothetical protein VCSRO104_0386 [Vibrio cholerae]GHX76775.1 hypothetical protein VCSRO209_0521 [Vibrio cholerae]